jgi:hypothetical protein
MLRVNLPQAGMPVLSRGYVIDFSMSAPTPKPNWLPNPYLKASFLISSAQV